MPYLRATASKNMNWYVSWGSGGFGITYLGYDHHLDKAVAIKEYLPNDLAVRTDYNSVLPKSTQDQADYEWGLERFLSEAQTLARFGPPAYHQNPSFLPRPWHWVYRDGVRGGGETLSLLLQRKGALTESELKAILFPILDGLEAVHRADFLHRDIKPGNIVIRDDGSPVLIDFGSARQAVAGKSRSVTAIVTPGYAPIEQYSAKGHQGPCTDIYALGAVCYRCLTGEAPNDATERLREDPLVPATERSKGKASASLLGAIDRALRVDEGERPQSVAEWREILAEGGKSGKYTTRHVTRADESSATVHAGMSWLSITLVAVIVVLLGASAWRGWHLYQGVPDEGTGETKAVAEEGERRPVKAQQVDEESMRQAATAKAREEAGEMVLIPGGTFRMGDLSGESDSGGLERPVHSVTVPPFRLGKYEVTFSQWDDCVADGGCGGYRPDDRGWGRGSRPVSFVSWDDAQVFIAWLNSKTDGGFRLPTEAEWEYAARAGSSTKYHFGDDESQLCRYANHADTSTDYVWRNTTCSDGVGERAAEVGRYQPNAFGLHDMHGNVWEWVQDCWNDSYFGAPGDGSAWESGDCRQRVVRGGSWYGSAGSLRSASRGWYAQTFLNIGFRLAQDQ